MANYCILWAGKLEIFGIGVACQNSHGVGWGLCVVSCNAITRTYTQHISFFFQYYSYPCLLCIVFPPLLPLRSFDC